MPVIPVPGKQKQSGQKFKVSLDFILRPYMLKKKKKEEDKKSIVCWFVVVVSFWHCKFAVTRVPTGGGEKAIK